MTDFELARLAMVDCQVRPADVTRYAIIDAMLAVPREQFVPRSQRAVAYAEADIPLGDGRYLLAPRTIAKMLEAADISDDDLILDIGPGLGYSSMLLAQLGAAVVVVEPDEAMGKQAAENFERLEVDNVVVNIGACPDGDPAHGPYDVIFVNGAMEHVPDDLLSQLRDGGRLVGLVAEGAVGQCRVIVRAGDAFGERSVFDVSAATLQGFEQPAEFAF